MLVKSPSTFYSPFYSTSESVEIRKIHLLTGTNETHGQPTAHTNSSSFLVGSGDSGSWPRLWFEIFGFVAYKRWLCPAGPSPYVAYPRLMLRLVVPEVVAEQLH